MLREKPDHIKRRIENTPEKVAKPVREQKSKIPLRQKRKGIGTNKTARRIDEARWVNILTDVSNGLTRPAIYKKHKISRETFEAYLVTHVSATKLLKEAELVWSRRNWSMDEIEQIFDQMCLGNTVKKSAKIIGWDEKRLLSFYQLARRDKNIRKMYDECRQIQAESWLDDNIDIADYDAEDTLLDGKGGERSNTAAIQRSNLRIQTRQWTMGAVHRKRFGDTKFIEHGGEIGINHAQQLGDARKRLEAVRTPVVIDSVTQEVVEE